MSILRDLHRWIGAGLALVVAAVALSGAVLVFRDPYYRAAFPEIRHGSGQASARALDEVERTLARELGDRRVRVLRLPHQSLPAFQVFLDAGGEALVSSDGARVLDRWEAHRRVMPFLFSLHAHLLGGDTASTLNGIVALVVVFLVMSGLLAWWPRRRAFPLGALLPRDMTRTSWLRSHVAVGVVAALPIAVFVATGTALVFNATVTRALSGAFDRTTAERPSARVSPLDRPAHSLAHLAAAARRTFPDAELTMFMPGTQENAAATFRLRRPGEWHPNGRTYVLVDPYNGHVVQAIDALQQGFGTRLAHAIYPVHAARGSASWMAMPAAISGLALAWLGAGGLVTFVKRLRQRRRSGPTVRARAA